MALLDVLQAIQTQVTTAINAAGIGNKVQVGIGWPVSTELVSILAQNDVEGQVSIYPLPDARNTTRYSEEHTVYTAPNLGLTATVAGGIATFSGTAASTGNIHGFLIGHNGDAYAAVTGGTTAAQAASALATAINGLAFSGVSAIASGAQTIVTGAAFAFLNLGGTGTIAIEVGRVRRGVQVSVWTSADPNDTKLAGTPRSFAIGDAIVGSIGQKNSLRIPLSDGTQIFIAYRTEIFSDDSQSSYSLYVRHIIFDVEYPVVQTLSATQVGAFRATEKTNQQTPTTSYFGGP